MTNWSEKEDVLKAVQQNGVALKFASKALRADPEIVKAAVEQDALALQFASEELQEELGGKK